MSLIKTDAIQTLAGKPILNSTGSVLQVLQAVKTANAFVFTDTYADVGLSQAITPSSTSSKIYIVSDNSIYINALGGGLRFLRDSTTIYEPASGDSNGPFLFYVSSGSEFLRVPMIYMDSPNTTSQVTYKIQAKRYASSANVTYNYTDVGNPSSTLTLMEIAG